MLISRASLPSCRWRIRWQRNLQACSSTDTSSIHDLCCLALQFRHDTLQSRAFLNDRRLGYCRSDERNIRTLPASALHLLGLGQTLTNNAATRVSVSSLLSHAFSFAVLSWLLRKFVCHIPCNLYAKCKIQCKVERAESRQQRTSKRS